MPKNCNKAEAAIEAMTRLKMEMQWVWYSSQNLLVWYNQMSTNQMSLYWSLKKMKSKVCKFYLVLITVYIKITYSLNGTWTTVDNCVGSVEMFYSIQVHILSRH